MRRRELVPAILAYSGIALFRTTKLDILERVTQGAAPAVARCDSDTLLENNDIGSLDKVHCV
jgi:hypothetical protein